ncbi:hypothetical protein, partial [Coleofasciculus sp. FACHB-712]|uniref:hypothetical protein n=1 Tax=Coleofasciculus sp. FACHB-712 TaxID=2692789 RepID=UPI001A7F0FF4
SLLLGIVRSSVVDAPAIGTNENQAKLLPTRLHRIWLARDGILARTNAYPSFASVERTEDSLAHTRNFSIQIKRWSCPSGLRFPESKQMRLFY